MSILTTTSEILDTLYDWAVQVIPNREVIISNSVDGGVPNCPYIALRLTQSPTSQNSIVKLSDDGETESIIQQCVFTVNVDCVGDEEERSAHAANLQLASSLYSSHRYQDLWKISGFGGVTIGPQSLTTATLATNRSRWQFQYTIYAQIDTQSEGQYFESAPLKVIEGTEPNIIFEGTIDGDNKPPIGECNGE